MTTSTGTITTNATVRANALPLPERMRKPKRVTPTAIEVAQLDFSYGAKQVLFDVNLALLARRVSAFIGPSGCGKSTILRMVAGLEDPTSGEIVIGEKNVTALEPRERNIAMVFQNYALYPHMSNYDNMAYGLKIAGIARDEIRKRVGKAAQILELTHLLARKPRELSGGMARRVALARAIALDPPLLLYDEPLSGLDPIATGLIINLIAQLNRELGLTSLIVTHHVHETLPIADWVLFIANGGIVFSGTPQALHASPDPLVQQFLNGGNAFRKAA